ncbi:metalloregulator ArsR/SmtB family transcription factor [Mesorhizobium sp. CO1-1-8]|uniref:ArsR/SmtB family transcription factor n=1 Tax=Mesorhizobium sp. CO1-1-8 TaxID=2876631 RepID=UPI001CD052F4|nr:metalloregulator ArsR/SmtB family transcription factor [Mesorhizobium sp. CO1-1-8]
MVGSPHRLLIFRHLRNGEVSLNAIGDNLQIRQSSLSTHLRKLRRLRLVWTRRDSQRVYYRPGRGAHPQSADCGAPPG